MAYGQTGTGKTFTLGRLGEEDTAARGIMVRAMEDILADVSLETDTVSASYFQVLWCLISHNLLYITFYRLFNIKRHIMALCQS
jgi:Kinesin motor domain